MCKQYPVSRKCILDVVLESMNLRAINSCKTLVLNLLHEYYYWPEIKHSSMLVRQCNSTIAVLCLQPVDHQSTGMQRWLGAGDHIT
jgi:hypothetical protein